MDCNGNLDGQPERQPFVPKPPTQARTGRPQPRRSAAAAQKTPAKPLPESAPQAIESDSSVDAESLVTNELAENFPMCSNETAEGDEREGDETPRTGDADASQSPSSGEQPKSPLVVGSREWIFAIAADFKCPDDLVLASGSDEGEIDVDEEEMEEWTLMLTEQARAIWSARDQAWLERFEDEVLDSYEDIPMISSRYVDVEFVEAMERLKAEVAAAAVERRLDARRLAGSVARALRCTQTL